MAELEKIVPVEPGVYYLQSASAYKTPKGWRVNLTGAQHPKRLSPPRSYSTWLSDERIHNRIATAADAVKHVMATPAARRLKVFYDGLELVTEFRESGLPPAELRDIQKELVATFGKDWVRESEDGQAYARALLANHIKAK